MLLLSQATRIQGRFAFLAASGSALILWLPETIAAHLAISSLRGAEYVWVVGVVFILSVGVFFIRSVEFMAAARRQYKANDDLREQLRSRTHQESSILERIREAGRTTVFIPPSENPEIQPLVALGLLQEVKPPELPDRAHGIYLVPLNVMRTLKEEHKKREHQYSFAVTPWDVLRDTIQAAFQVLNPATSIQITLKSAQQQKAIVEALRLHLQRAPNDRRLGKALEDESPDQDEKKD